MERGGKSLVWDKRIGNSASYNVQEGQEVRRQIKKRRGKCLVDAKQPLGRDRNTSIFDRKRKENSKTE